jgi:pimeloyl-ACP methyl ester carboxylesterase
MPDVDGPITYQLMADDMIAFLETVVGQPADLVGHRDGAFVAMLVAMQRHELVKRLVMISGGFNKVNTSCWTPSPTIRSRRSPRSGAPRPGRRRRVSLPRRPSMISAGGSCDMRRMHRTPVWAGRMLPQAPGAGRDGTGSLEGTAERFLGVVPDTTGDGSDRASGKQILGQVHPPVGEVADGGSPQNLAHALLADEIFPVEEGS